MPDRRAGEAHESGAEDGLIGFAKPDLKRLQRARHSVTDKDSPVLAAAVASSAGIFVTGDRRHFGQLFGSNVDDTRIMSLARTLEAVLDEGPA